MSFAFHQVFGVDPSAIGGMTPAKRKSHALTLPQVVKALLSIDHFIGERRSCCG
jgi:hypothetical protein